MTSRSHPLSSLLIILVCALVVFSTACNRTPPPSASTASSKAGPKRYALKGKVISLDKNASSANINNEPIAGFMDPMVMPYPIKPPTDLNQLQPGDTITADVVVDGEKYWLENLKVISHAENSGKPSASMHIPAPGDEVPDFK